MKINGRTFVSSTIALAIYSLVRVQDEDGITTRAEERQDQPGPPPPPFEVRCKCGRTFATERGARRHWRDYHGGK